MDYRTVSRRHFIAGGLALAAVNVVGVGRAAAGVALPWDGSGTLEDPYVVTTVEELQNMNTELDKHFVLGNDIDASETATWTNYEDVVVGFDPIGDDLSQFEGSLDGEGYTIDGLTIALPSNSYVGPFGWLTGTVRDLSLTNVDVTGRGNVGGLAGRVVKGSIKDVSVAGTVRGEDDVGGLVGHLNDGSVRYSSAAVDVEGTAEIGGLVGYSSGGSIKYASASGDVTGQSRVGGFAGFTYSPIENASAAGAVTGAVRVGGFTGHAGYLISAAYATGAVTGEPTKEYSHVSQVGGFAGYSDSPYLVEIYAAGPVSTSYPYAFDVGGLVGHVSEKVHSIVAAAFWDREATGQETSATGLDRTTAQMTGMAAETNLEGFDFGATWYATESYPRLTWSRPPVAGDGPADFTVEDDEGESTVRFSTHTPAIGEEVTVTVDVSNVGGKSGRFIGNLNDGFTSLGRANPRLQPGESTTLTYTVTFEKRGMHRLFLGSDHIGDVHVQRA